MFSICRTATRSATGDEHLPARVASNTSFSQGFAVGAERLPTALFLDCTWRMCESCCVREAYDVLEQQPVDANVSGQVVLRRLITVKGRGVACAAVSCYTLNFPRQEEFAVYTLQTKYAPNPPNWNMKVLPVFRTSGPLHKRKVLLMASGDGVSVYEWSRQRLR